MNMKRRRRRRRWGQRVLILIWEHSRSYPMPERLQRHEEHRGDTIHIERPGHLLSSRRKEPLAAKHAYAQTPRTLLKETAVKYVRGATQ
ncbi:hypothetical protein FOCG_13422 [Fusarium oxysporum f. sp. radicis-lycopersici 26381]|nr:hypothetical protein FOCG_13422 [Fusarium oxysporum f. sp. radicis-lycopersici 26381]